MWPEMETVYELLAREFQYQPIPTYQSFLANLVDRLETVWLLSFWIHGTRFTTERKRSITLAIITDWEFRLYYTRRLHQLHFEKTKQFNRNRFLLISVKRMELKITWQKSEVTMNLTNLNAEEIRRLLSQMKDRKVNNMVAYHSLKQPCLSLVHSIR